MIVLTFFAINVCLKDPVLVIELNAPSIAEDQISVQLNKGTVLSISGTRSVGDKKKVFLHKERLEGRFEPLLNLPFPVDADRVDTRVELGVLTVKLPRLASSLPRRIPAKKCVQPGRAVQQSPRKVSVCVQGCSREAVLETRVRQVA